MLCTSSFIDVVFAHNGWEQTARKGKCCFQYRAVFHKNIVFSTERLNGGQEGFDTAAYSQTDPPGGSTAVGAAVKSVYDCLVFVGFYAIRCGIKIMM